MIGINGVIKIIFITFKILFNFISQMFCVPLLLLKVRRHCWTYTFLNHYQFFPLNASMVAEGPPSWLMSFLNNTFLMVMKNTFPSIMGPM